MEFINKPTQSVIYSLHYAEWTIKDFKVLFLLSDPILTEVRKISCLDDWYDDPVAAATYIDLINTCFISIQQYYNALGILPQIGDRLYGEETGMIVQERFIDGRLMTITFKLNL